MLFYTDTKREKQSVHLKANQIRNLLKVHPSFREHNGNQQIIIFIQSI